MSEKKAKRIGIIVLILSLVLLASGAMLLWQSSTNKHAITKGYPGLGGNFVLQSAEGPVSLSDYKGKVVVLYFGYAFCPDVCPGNKRRKIKKTETKKE